MNKKLIVVSGFSGAGKGSILKFLKERSDIEIVRSVTTRPQRNADDYYEFVSISEFEHRLAAGSFLEANRYSSGYYGTPLDSVKQIMSGGRIPLLEIDCNGYRQVLESGYFSPDKICSIFVAADGIDLLSRFHARGTENIPQIIRRLETALIECGSIPLYNSVLLNRYLQESEEKVLRILSGETVLDPFDIEVFKKETTGIIATLKAQMKGEM